MAESFWPQDNHRSNQNIFKGQNYLKSKRQQFVAAKITPKQFQGKPTECTNIQLFGSNWPKVTTHQTGYNQICAHLGDFKHAHLPSVLNSFSYISMDSLRKTICQILVLSIHDLVIQIITS